MIQSKRFFADCCDGMVKETYDRYIFSFIYLRFDVPRKSKTLGILLNVINDRHATCKNSIVDVSAQVVVTTRK